MKNVISFGCHARKARKELATLFYDAYFTWLLPLTLNIKSDSNGIHEWIIYSF